MTQRQKIILQAIPKCGILADVGCDHGNIGLEALLTGRAEQVLFCDISSPSLDKARALCIDNNVTSNVEFYNIDGLGSLQCDCAVIAGMGGREIISILSFAEKLPNTLVLQPMKNQYDLRKYLCNEYDIITDSMFCDSKYYDCIVAVRGHCFLAEDELTFGKDNLNGNKVFCDYLEMRIEKFEKLLDNAPNTVQISQKLNKYKEIYLTIKE
ncbi:MAG: class I SAM-dependent methyltransferase [Clostridia bacterium]